MSAERSEVDTVRALAALHGLSIPDDEIELFAANYAEKRRAMEVVYRLDGIRREEPAVVFRPAE